MIEAGSYTRFDRVIVVYCPYETQVARLCARDGLTPEQARQKLASQMPIEEKVKYAHYVIDNSGEIRETERRTRALFHQLEQDLARKKAGRLDRPNQAH
jgi:dephospho-CoA kinase